MVVWYHRYIICIWVWLYIWLYVCIMWDCKCGILALWLYWLCVCGVRDMMTSDWYIHVWYDLIMALYIRILWEAAWLEFLYVVLNTTCNCIWRYAIWILVLYYVAMCVYVDNYVDNSLIYVDNFLLQMQHFYELFWKYYIFVYFRTLSLVISYLLLFSRFFIIS